MALCNWRLWGFIYPKDMNAVLCFHLHERGRKGSFTPHHLSLHDHQATDVGYYSTLYGVKLWTFLIGIYLGRDTKESNGDWTG